MKRERRKNTTWEADTKGLEGRKWFRSTGWLVLKRRGVYTTHSGNSGRGIERNGHRAVCNRRVESRT